MAPTGVELFSRANQEQIGDTAPVLLDTFLYFNLIPNTIFLPILVAVFLFSKGAKRHPTLVNVCMTWILSAIFSLLLFYAGRHKPTDPLPSPGLCIAQTSLLYGITPMWSVAVLVLVYHMIVINSDRPPVGRKTMMAMLSAPYIVECIFTIITFAIASQKPQLVSRTRRFFYCSIDYDPLAYGMSIFTFIVCVAIIVLEVQLGARLYRNWKGIKKSGYDVGVEPHLIVRILMFGVYVLFGMIVNLISMTDVRSVLPDMYAATVGSVVLLVFGSHPTVLRALCFWRPDKAPIPQPIAIPKGEIFSLGTALPTQDEERVFYARNAPPVPPIVLQPPPALRPLVPNRYGQV